MNESSNWDGHQFDPAGRLSLPERTAGAANIQEALFALDLVDVAEKAIVEAAVTRHSTALVVESVEGFPHDFAVAVTCAVLETWAAQMVGDDGEGADDAAWVRHMAEIVRDVPAVTEV